MSFSAECLCALPCPPSMIAWDRAPGKKTLDSSQMEGTWPACMGTAAHTAGPSAPAQRRRRPPWSAVPPRACGRPQPPRGGQPREDPLPALAYGHDCRQHTPACRLAQVIPCSRQKKHSKCIALQQPALRRGPRRGPPTTCQPCFRSRTGRGAGLMCFSCPAVFHAHSLQSQSPQQQPTSRGG